MNSFLSPLELEYLDGQKWTVTQEFDYLTQSGEMVKIPAGFVTDFASVPKLLWNILPPTGSYGKAAVVHDWLYQFRIITRASGELRYADRAEADRVFLEGAKLLGAGWWTRAALYAGVRAGGWKPWNAYRAKEARMAQWMIK